MKTILMLLLFGIGLPSIVSSPLLLQEEGASAPLPQEAFDLVKKQGAVTLYQRWVQMPSGFSVRELKAEFTVAGNVRQVLAFLQDGRQAAHWMRSAAEVKMFPLSGEDAWVSYIRYQLPWPLKDQDCLLRHQAREVANGTAVRVRFHTAVETLVDQKREVTRMEGIEGSWQLDPLGDQGTRVSYRVMTTRKPTLPRWITDPFVQKNLLNTFNDFCQQIASR